MKKDLAKKDEFRDFVPSFIGQLFNPDFLSIFDVSKDVPAMNVKETDKEYKLEVSAPGFDKEDFSLDLNDDVLTISAKKETKNDEKDKNDKVIRQEFCSSSFSRSFVLFDDVDEDKISATQKNGVLEIILPKSEKVKEEEKTKKIEIK